MIMEIEKANGSRIEKRDIRRMAWRTLTMQASWNYERQMHMAFMYSIAPLLDKIYCRPEDRELKIRAYKRHMEFFNCTPQTSSFIVGLAASMEERFYNDRENFDEDSINAVKTSLMGPLAGIGDSFFQGTFRIIAFGLGISFAQQGSVLGPILAVLLFAIPSLLSFYYGGFMGYTAGQKYITQLYKEGLMEKVMYIATAVGLVVIGGMIASLIGLTTPLHFVSGSVTFKLQSVLDSMVPQVLSLAATMLMYRWIRKGADVNRLLLGIIVAGLVLNYFGILG